MLKILWAVLLTSYIFIYWNELNNKNTLLCYVNSFLQSYLCIIINAFRYGQV